MLKKETGRDPFNQNSDRSDREKRTTSKGGPVFSKLFRLDRTDPLSFGPKFPEILVESIAPLVEWIAPTISCEPRSLNVGGLDSGRLVTKSQHGGLPRTVSFWMWIFLHLRNLL